MYIYINRAGRRHKTSLRNPLDEHNVMEYFDSLPGIAEAECKGCRRWHPCKRELTAVVQPGTSVRHVGAHLLKGMSGGLLRQDGRVQLAGNTKAWKYCFHPWRTALVILRHARPFMPSACIEIILDHYITHHFKLCLKIMTSWTIIRY
jgi:hypothetical protein